jgi:beta-N-acetylhexosaminidase
LKPFALSLAATALLGAAHTPPTPDAALDQLVARLSLRDRAAQLVMPWIPGTYAATDDPGSAMVRRWIDTLHVGGVIVSVGSPVDIAAKLNQLQKRSRLPLLVASDLEEGTARRFVGGTPFPTNMGVAAGGREADAFAMGRVTAEEGRAVGIHLAFAPVADVNSNPANPIINVRSFGEDPLSVAALVVAEVRGLQQHGMLATVKHFPGHGDTEIDSHLALPTVQADWARLDSLELVPFRAAIKAGVAAVMSAHIAVPTLENGGTRPSTLEPTILTGILRDSLRFRGLAVTDALDMGAVWGTYGATEAPVLALLAGADLLLQPTSPDATIDAIVAAVRDGRLTQQRLNQSVRRVLAAKQRLGLFARRTVQLDRVSTMVGSAEHQSVARDVAARSIVLLSDSTGAIDSLRARPRRVALVTYAEDPGILPGYVLANELRALGDTVRVFRIWPSSGPASYDSARAVLAEGGVPVFAAAVRAMAGRGRVALPDSLVAFIESTANANPTVLLSLGSPYLLLQTPQVTSHLLAWSANPLSETAAARALSGAPITGRLPITIPPTFQRGAGLDRPAAPRVTTLTSERR